MQRAREEREARSLMEANDEIRSHGRRAADANTSGGKHRRGTDRVVDDSSTGTRASELPSRGRVVRLAVEARQEEEGHAAGRGEHGRHAGHDGGISGGQGFTNNGGLGEIT